ncbi:hypothetical protein [Streptomyces sp. DH24]|uniref:DUF6907 domain-containing protein n=1 Tax=Streptomyces sp. DH24 TaxID=3040123 RepID=UPI0024422B68|nr:hypothetical protein [Streptomyces sp. DH24]MDG9717426.1 hypothetical protein [Streptomyces sp. DH24]
MSTEPRTAQVSVFVTKSLEIDEPDWCAGHGDDRAQYKVDITHYGPEHTITAPSGEELFRAMLSQSPFSSVDRTIGLYVETGDFTGTRTPEEVEQLADALVQAAEQLRALGQELAAVLGGENR